MDWQKVIEHLKTEAAICTSVAGRLRGQDRYDMALLGGILVQLANALDAGITRDTPEA